MSSLGGSNRLICSISAANMQSTADQPCTAAYLAGSSWRIQGIVISGCTATPSGAVGGWYTAPNKSGTQLVGAAQTYAGLTSIVNAPQLAFGPTIYLSLGSRSASPATCSFYVYGADAK